MSALVEPLLVLVVEDDGVIRETLCEILQEEGFAAHGVGTLDEARASVSSLDPAVMILDLMLHELTSEPLLVELAKATKAPATILMSAASDAPRIADAYRIPLLRKPFDLDHALALVQRARREGLRPHATR